VSERFRHDVLRRARLDLDLTQTAAAELLGIDVRTYRRYESGQVNEGGFLVRNASRREVLQRLQVEFGLTSEDLVESSQVSCIVHALPRARHFVGRKDQLLAIEDHLRRGPGVVAIVGVGGSGKTSLADRIASGVEGMSLFVFSCYDDPGFESLLERAIGHFAPDRSLSRSDRWQALASALVDHPGTPLLVFDGLEVHQADHGNDLHAAGEIRAPALRHFLQRCAAGLGRVRVLLTTRFEPIDLAAYDGDGFHRLSLAGLDEHEAATLLECWGVSASPGSDRLRASMGGHPLSLAMLCSYAVFLGELPDDLDLGLAATDDPLARRLHAMLERYRASLPAETLAVLEHLTIFPTGAGAREVADLLGGPRADVQHQLARLERWGLVFKQRDGGYSAHPFVRDFFRASLGSRARQAHARRRDVLRASLERAPGIFPEDREVLDHVESLILHTVGAGDTAEAWRLYVRSLGGFEHYGLCLGEMVRGERITVAFLERGDPHRPVEGLDEESRLRLVYDRGLVLVGLGRTHAAIDAFRAYHGWVLQDPFGSITGYRTLAYTHRLRGEWDSALELVTRSIDLATRWGHLGHLARGLALQAAIFGDLGRSDQALASFERCRDVAGTPYYRRALWEAELACRLGRYETARSMATDNRPRCEARNWEGHVAHCDWVIAMADACRGLDHSAPLENIRRWVERSGEVEMQLRLLALESQLTPHRLSQWGMNGLTWLLDLPVDRMVDTRSESP